MNGPRTTDLIARLNHLLISRTRQREVFGPGWIMLVVGGVLCLDAVTGTTLPPTIRLALVALLSAWAGLLSWQHYRDAHTREFLMAGAFLVLGGVGILIGLHLQLPWALLLIAFALRLLLGRKG